MTFNVMYGMALQAWAIAIDVACDNGCVASPNRVNSRIA
jgi:hypothetical protein